MCGIVGLASNYTNGFNQDEANAFQDMLVIDSFRGLDSTGVFGVDRNASVRIAKSAQHGLDFVLEQEFTKLRTELLMRGLFAVGHNRAATKGGINDRNAHPFWVDDKIILVQNGTLRGDHKTLTENTKELEVDSEAIAHVLAEESDIEKALQKIDSAYALVWFNVETETLHLIRNYERPLWIAEGKNSGMIWASEEATLDYVIKKYRLPMKPPSELPASMLVSLKLTGDSKNYEVTHKRIDNHFRNKFTGGRSYNGGGFPWSPIDTDGWDLTCEGYGGVRAPREDPEVPHTSLLPGPKLVRHDFHDSHEVRARIEIQFNDWALVNLRDDFLIPANEVQSRMKQVTDYAGEGERKIFVEALDFFPANKHALCNAFHVYGEVMIAGEESSKILCHWIEHRKTISGMREVLAAGFYEARYTAIHVNRLKVEAAEMAMLITYGFGTIPQKHIIPEVENATSQLH